MHKTDFAIVVPMANEQETFHDYVDAVKRVLDSLGTGHVYVVIDKASRDDTLELSRELSSSDDRFSTIWAPENRNVVDAYIRGLREAFAGGHEAIIEMDAGLSHDPVEVPNFLAGLEAGCHCVFGSRYTAGGRNVRPPIKRAFLSRGGTLLSNFLLGTRLADMTSGYEAFSRDVVEKIISYPLRSRAHFFQTEIRYLLRHAPQKEIPIVYRSPSQNASGKAVRNSIYCLVFYLMLRMLGRAPSLTERENT